MKQGRVDNSKLKWEANKLAIYKRAPREKKKPLLLCSKFNLSPNHIPHALQVTLQGRAWNRE